MKHKGVAGVFAGLLLAGACGAVWGYRRKHRVAVPAKNASGGSRPSESPEHAALQQILERSVAYNNALYERLLLVEKASAEARPAAVEVLSHANQEARDEINALRTSLQELLADKKMQFCDIDGFNELISRYRCISLEQQERHLELYHRVVALPAVPDSPELHAYLKLGYNDAAAKQADTDMQICLAAQQQRDMMLRVGRLLSSVRDADSAEPVPEELLKLSRVYQDLTDRIKRYRQDDEVGAYAAIAELKSMYAALTPPLREQAAQLRAAGCYGNKLLFDILIRLLPDKR